MQLSTLFTALVASTAVVVASPVAGIDRRDSFCPVQSCKIVTSGTGWSSAYMRQNPCNNQAPIKTLYNGNVVYKLGTPNQSGCGYNYMQVLVTGSNGKNTVGWVGSQFVQCGSTPPAPAPAAASSSSSTTTA